MTHASTGDGRKTTERSDDTTALSRPALPLCSPSALLLLFLLLAFGLAAPAQTHAAQSFRSLQIQDPATTSWREGIRLSLPVDEEACRRAYGANWVEDCLKPPLGAPGSRVSGVTLRPHVAGEWRWDGPDSMRFTPTTETGALPADTDIEIDLSGVPLPADVVVDRRKTLLHTQPQAVLVDRETVWLDPSSRGSHGVSLPLSFVWPVAEAHRQDMEKAVHLAPEDSSSGLLLGDPSFAWNATGDGVVVSAPIRRLARTDARVRLSVRGVPSFRRARDGRVIDAPGKDAAATFGLPGRDNLFTVAGAALERGHDSALNVRHELVLRTTLQADPMDVARALTVLLLPEKAEPDALEPTDWTKMPGIATRDVQGAQRINPVPLSGRGASDTFRFALNVPAGRCVAVLVSRDMKSTGGLKPKTDVVFVLAAPERAAELSFLLPGNLVSLAGSRKIPLHSVGVDTVRWRARRVEPSFLALYAASHSFSTSSLTPWDRKVDLDTVSRSVEGSFPVPPGRGGEASFPILDLEKILPGGERSCGLFRMELKGLRDGREVVSEERMLLLTNIGLVVKENADGSRSVFVLSLFSGTPMSGVEVMVLGKNGTTLARDTSNAHGLARLPSTRGFSGENEPVAIVARSTGRDPDLSWISLADPGRVLPVDESALAGRHTSGPGLMASVFSERGLYMPGDTLHFGALVRRFDWENLPQGLPLEAVLTDPAGHEVLRTRPSFAAGLCEVAWTSSVSSPTGPYRFDIRLREDKGRGPVLGSTTVRVEEFQPDTLSLNVSMKRVRPKGWIRVGGNAGRVDAFATLGTLYGEAARGHDVRAEFRMVPARVSPAGYEDYIFHDASIPLTEARTVPLPQRTTDERGEARFVLPTGSAMGTFRGTLRVEGFEAGGGRAVAAEESALFSPLEYIVGYRPLERANPLDAIPLNAGAAVRVIALNCDLAAAPLDNVRCIVQSRRYVNALVRDERGQFRYQTTPVGQEISSKTVEIGLRGTRIDLPTDRAGDFLLVLKREDGTVLLQVPWTVIGPEVRLADGTSSLPLADGDLRLRLNKKDYEPGETITVSLNTPYAGTGLVTVERDNVVSSAWFRAGAGESEQRVRIPETFEGRGYVSVFFARTSNDDAIYVNPVTHATVSFGCGRGKRDMGLAVEASPSVRPGGRLQVRVTSKRPGKALVYAVDEGILSLTGYKTPDPLTDLLDNRALDVVTRQAFDLLMPDIARLRGRLPAFGGDEAAGPGGRFLNPFRRRGEPPFAMWLGMVDTDPKGTELSVPVPSHLSGKIRVVAVGTSASVGPLAAGAAESSSTVRGTLLVHPNLPLAASPGDSFTGSVTLANTVKGSGVRVPVLFHVTADPGIALVDARSRETNEITYSLFVDENGEQTVPVHVRVKDQPGSHGITFRTELASQGVRGNLDRSAFETRRRQEFSVRPMSVAWTRDTTGILADLRDRYASADVLEIPQERRLYPMDAATSITVGQGPLTAFRALLARLDTYPFGCVEQRISRAAPWLAALAAPELEAPLFAGPNHDPAKEVEFREKLVEEALSAIRANLVDGGVSLWPTGPADDFVTVYAADFVVSLAASGRGVPADLLERLLAAVQAQLWRDPADLAEVRVRALACRVLLRAGKPIAQDVERLHQWLSQRYLPWKEDVTAALLADCFAQLRLEKRALEIMPATVATINPKENSVPFLDTATARALHALILSGNFWRDAAAKNPAMARGLDRAMNGAVDMALATGGSTTAMAVSARALATAAATPSRAVDVRLSCLEYEPGFENVSYALEFGGLKSLEAPGCLRFGVKTAKGAALDGLRWHVRSHGYDRGRAVSDARGLEVRRRLLDARGRETDTLAEGDTCTVELTVRSDRPLTNVVLVDLLPGGLEPVIDRESISTTATHVERREDRMIFVLSTDTRPQLTTYRARAVTRGYFGVPALHAEAMYDPSVQATVAGTNLTVTDRRGEKPGSGSAVTR